GACCKCLPRHACISLYLDGYGYDSGDDSYGGQELAAASSVRLQCLGNRYGVVLNNADHGIQNLDIEIGFEDAIDYYGERICVVTLTSDQLGYTQDEYYDNRLKIPLTDEYGERRAFCSGLGV